MMPEMDGIETLHKMQKLEHFPNEKTPVVALTANIFYGDREAYMKEGFNDFLAKPIETNLLEQMILSYLPKELVLITEQTEALHGKGHGQPVRPRVCANHDDYDR